MSASFSISWDMSRTFIISVALKVAYAAWNQMSHVQVSRPLSAGVKGKYHHTPHIQSFLFSRRTHVSSPARDPDSFTIKKQSVQSAQHEVLSGD